MILATPYSSPHKTNGSRLQNALSGFGWMIAFGLFLMHLPEVNAQKPVILHSENHDDLKSIQTPAITFQNRNYNSMEELEIAAGNWILQLQTMGYPEASVDSIQEDSLAYHLWIYSGPFYQGYLLKLNPEGIETALAAGLKSSLSGTNILRSGDKLAEIIRYLNEHGYPFAGAHIRSIHDSAGITLFHTDIERGPYCIWGTPEIKGSAEIRESTLQKILGIKKGEPYSRKTLEDLNRRIESLHYLKQTRPYSVIVTNEGEVRPVLFLDKEPASGFNGLAGFGSDKENPGKVIFSGDATLHLANAFGAAEEADLQWVGISNDQQLNIFYRQPYLPLLPFGFLYRFDLLKKSELYYTLNQRGGITIKSSPEAWFTAFTERNISKVLDRSIFQQATLLPERTDFTSTFFGIEYQFRRLDLIRNPGSGISFRGELAAGQKKLNDAADIPEEIIEAAGKLQRQAVGKIDGIVYIPLFNLRWILMTGIQAAYKYTPQHLENEMMLIGGIHSLRGFDEKSISASAFALGTLELRYRFEASSHVKVFLDYGWYERITTVRYQRDTPYGFGAGLAIPSAAGILEISYAFGIEQNNPFDFRSGRVHLGLTALF